MGKIKPPPSVKYFAGVLVSDEKLLVKVRQFLKELVGEIILESRLIPFNFTHYYREEMGEKILRKFYLFENLEDPGKLATLKIRTNEIEKEFYGEMGFKRPVNIDPGYIESSKVILASTKNFFHRIYIGNGIFAEVTIHWRKGKWNSFEWTYPDYRTPEYHEFFTEARKIYLQELKSEKKDFHS